MRSRRLAGRSVRATSHAMGAAKATHSPPTASEVQSVVHSGFTKLGSEARWRKCASVRRCASSVRLVQASHDIGSRTSTASSTTIATENGAVGSKWRRSRASGNPAQRVRAPPGFALPRE